MHSSRSRSGPDARAYRVGAMLAALALVSACGGGGGGSSRAAPVVLGVIVVGTETFSGTMGGPFTPSSASYTLTNPSSDPQAWSVASSEPWLTVPVSSGTLAANASVNVTATIDAALGRALAEGPHTAELAFTNTTSGNEDERRSLTLNVALEPGLLTRVGPQRVAAFLVHFQDVTEPLTPSALRTRLIVGPDSANDWFQEVSFGKMSLTGSLFPDGDVFEVTLPVSSQPCDYDLWGDLAQAQAAPMGFVASNYDLAIYVFAGTCRSRGRPQWTPPSAWADNGGLRALCHEGGHALGWAHASAYDCTGTGGNVSLSSSCSVLERDDEFDMMGLADTYHTSAQKRGQIGWLDPANTMTVTEDGVYVIAPIELASTQVQSLRIPRIVGPTGIEQFFFLETRQPTGSFETFPPNHPAVTGVTLRLAGRYDMPGRTFLVDTHPATATYDDAPIQPGEVFTDPETGTTLQVLSVGPSGAAIDVTLGATMNCVPATPFGAFTPTATTAAAGTNAMLSMTVRNEDVDCAVAALVGTYDLPPGWENVEYGTFEASLVPGASETTAIELPVPASATPGDYTISVTLVNASTGSSTSYSAIVTVP